MKPAEEIGIDELNESGIVHVGLEFCPTIGFDEIGEPFLSGTSAFHFIDRYNNKKIALQNKFGSYLENEDIQSCLHSLELDPVMFWYLLLFVYDYCVDTCIDNIKTEEGTSKQIQKFIQTIEERKEQPAELTLKIGKNKFILTDSQTIDLIGFLCKEAYPKVKDAFIFGDRIMLEESVEYSDTAMAYLFCKMLRCYFDSSNHVKEKRAEGANISNKEKELLSYLLYFAGISRNKNLLTPILNEYNTLKGLMNPKKKPEFRGIGNWYA